MVTIKLTLNQVKVPADVPASMKTTYIKNFLLATKNTGKLMLFAGDQRLEHLNDDFFGKGISKDDADPEHFFKIASKATIGIFAAQHGLIARYANDYKKVPYLVKINSRTKLVPGEPISQSLVDFEDVLVLKKSNINVVGIGYTLYLGSELEDAMLSEAGRFITRAHQNGMIAVLWIYPRGVAVKKPYDPHLIAGAAGVAVCMGADFVKVTYPESKNPAIDFHEAVVAAGRTGVITSGGGTKSEKEFLQDTFNQIHISGTRGSATGRNIHQKSLEDAIRMCNAISSIVYGDKSVDFAFRVYKGEKVFKI